MKGEFCNKDVIEEASERLDTPKFLVKKIEQHWHKFVFNTITSGNFENILIPFLVKFEFNQRKMNALNLKKAKYIKL